MSKHFIEVEDISGFAEAYPPAKGKNSACRSPIRDSCFTPPRYQLWICSREKDHRGPHAAHTNMRNDPKFVWGECTEEEWDVTLCAARLGVPVSW